MAEQRIPVLVVGGGTVGLAAALLLARHGIMPLVLEQRDGMPDSPQAIGIGPRTMEILRQAGLERAVSEAVGDKSAGAVNAGAVDLGARDLGAEAIGNAWGVGDLSPVRVHGACPQYRLDGFLLSAARDGGARVRFSARVTGCAVTSEGVAVTLDTGEVIEADYLIAADGVYSTVREQLGMGGPEAVGEPTTGHGLDPDRRSAGAKAGRFDSGRAYLVGEAAHTAPSTGGSGLDLGLADVHNLAWKLAAVLRGDAGPDLLDTYTAERRPVGRRAATRTLHPAVVDLGYRYDSAAVIDPDPALPSTEDVRADLDGTPGSRLPHHWLAPGVSTLDLVRTHCVLIGGNHRWIAAVTDAATALGIPLDSHAIPLSGKVLRPWADTVGITPGGALLVRPDQIIAARIPTMPPAPARLLRHLLTRILAR